MSADHGRHGLGGGVAEREIEVLIGNERIHERIGEIAREIDADFSGGELVVVGVLKGSFIFMSDLVRRIERPLSCDFIRVSSYEDDRSTGVVRMEFDMTQPIEGKNVLLIEDIVDTGKTLRYLLGHLKAKNTSVTEMMFVTRYGTRISCGITLNYFVLKYTS